MKPKEAAAMANHFKYDPYREPALFMKDIVDEMQAAFKERAEKLTLQCADTLAAKVAEVDAVIANKTSASAQDVRMACLHLVFGNPGAYTFVDVGDPADRAEALAQYVLTGKKPEKATIAGRPNRPNAKPAPDSVSWVY